MIVYPDSLDQLKKLVTDAIPSYDHVDRDWENDGSGTPAFSCLDSREAFSVPAARVDEAVAHIQEQVDEDDLGWASIADNRYWEDLLATGSVADPIRLGAIFGWGTGHPQRTASMPWYVGGAYGDYLVPDCLKFLWLIAPFCSTEARVIFGSGKDFDATRPAFALGLREGRFYFETGLITTVTYE